MPRAMKWPIRWIDSKSALKIATLAARTQDYALKLYYLGNESLDELFTSLPELFFHKECETIKSEKKIRVVRLPLPIGRLTKSAYIKEHNALSFRHRLASLISPSAARRSLYGAVVLLEKGYATARPVAAVEYRRWGLLIKSFYVSEEIVGATTIADYWREKLFPRKDRKGRLKRRAVLRALARLLQSLHAGRIYHNDLKGSNILVVDNGSTGPIFNLIDLQGARRCFYLSERRRVKNLVQINRTLGNHSSKTEKLVFLKAYMGNEIHDRSYMRHLVQRVLDETSRQTAKREKRRRSRLKCEAGDEQALHRWPIVWGCRLDCPCPQRPRTCTLRNG